jgi:hypothetical protein
VVVGAIAGTTQANIQENQKPRFPKMTFDYDINTVLKQDM